MTTSQAGLVILKVAHMGMATHKHRHAAVALHCLTVQSDSQPQTRPSFVSRQWWDSVLLCPPSTVSQHLSGCLS